MPENSPAEWKRCEYVLVNYHPSALQEARIAIGLFLFDGAGPVRCRFTDNWRRARCLDPQADLALLTGISSHFQSAAAARSAAELREDLDRMQREFSGSIQFSPPRGVLAADPEQEFDRLFRQYIAPPELRREGRAVREGTRPWIHAQLADALHRHSLWDLVARDLPVDEFTAPGDGFRIDFSYRPNGETRYLHALSLDRDWNHAKLLSYTFWRIRQKSPAAMTAIVNGDGAHLSGAAPPAPLPGRTARNCRRILSDSGIAIQPLSSIDPFLDSVARELGIN